MLRLTAGSQILD